MKQSLILIALLVLPGAVAYAHVPTLVEQTSLRDIDTIADPTLSQAFYGTLEGYPHTYEIRAKDPFLLHVEVLIPDIEKATENVSGIIIKEVGKQGRVTEVSRLLAQDAMWESFYEPWGGDSYRRGSSYEAQVDPGVYRIEVSTPDNTAPYVLVVGTREEMSIGYFETIGRLMEVKKFFGKSKLMVIVSPFVYIPLLVMLLIGVSFYLYRRFRQQK